MSVTRGRSPRRRAGIAAAAALLAVGIATAAGSRAAGAGIGWSISASPTTLVVGQSTQIAVRLTSSTDEIGCMRLTIPAGATVNSAASVSPSTWTEGIQLQANGSTVVTFCARSLADALTSGGAATFRVTATLEGAGQQSWSAAAFSDLLMQKPLGALVVHLNGRAAPTPTPLPSATRTPSPTATPTPAPTAARTPAPTVTPRLTTPPTPGPSATDTEGPTASGPAGSSPTPVATEIVSPSPGPSGTPAESASPTPAASTQSSAEPGAGPVTTPGGSGGGGATMFQIPARGGVTIEGIFGGLGPMGWGDVFRWMVPAFSLGLPGLLVILAVLAQLAGGFAFVPIVRRTMGASSRRRAITPVRPQ